MSPLLYTIVCAVGSLVMIALADYAYKTISAKWGKGTSLARKQQQREHTDLAQHLVDARPDPVRTQQEKQEPARDEADELEEYAKSLLKDTKNGR